MPRQVSEVFVEQLGDWGVRQVFGVMGETILGLLGALRGQERVRFVATQTEQAAAFAASAYAKLTGRLAACIATGGPGVTSLMTGVFDAHSDRVPMLAITGQVRRAWQHENAWQDIDAHALFETASVFNAAAQTPAQVPTLLAGAVQAALSQRDVAHLAVPMDIQTIEADIEPIRPHGHLNWSLAVASDEAVREAARLLHGASRPLILAGSGASGAQEPLLHLARRLGAPVLTTCRSKGLLPAGEPLSMGIPGTLGTPLANGVLREADTILVVGCSLSQRTTGDWQLVRPQQQIVQVDADPGRIGRIFPVEVGLLGDAAPTLRALMSFLPEETAPTSWGDLESRKREFRRQVDRKATMQSRPIKPQFAVRTLQETLPANAIIGLDAGDNAFFMCQQYEPKGEQFVMSYHLGSSGYGLPAAIAAALAFPERPSVAVVGDGGLASSLGELITAVAYSLPLTVVCFNNARMGMMDSEEERLNMAPFFTELPPTNYARVAEACGAQGLRVEEPSALAEALHRALAARRPFVVDVAIDPLERESTALEPAMAMARV
jgi:pyruvate oxidase